MIIFSDVCRATLDGPANWIRGWISMETDKQHDLEGSSKKVE